jgi:nuclear pore complex protein Nup155
MLLGLASGNTFLDLNLTTGNLSTISPEIAAVAKQAFYDFGERPIWTERVMYGTCKFCFVSNLLGRLIIVLAENKGSAIFSGRREGFALYFARLVRPIWKLKVTSTRQVYKIYKCTRSFVDLDLLTALPDYKLSIYQKKP